MKPGVMQLVVFTAVAGMLLAPGVGQMHPLIFAIAVMCVAVASGAGGAINMWFDRDIDAVMLRTVSRPIPAGRVQPADALWFGVILSVASVSLMGLAVNWAAASLLALAIGFYVFVYTMWLKRRTPQNIVIGGAAGAFPPMIGWAAVTGEVSLYSIVLFLIIFLWTPPHFWSLALYRSGDYQRAGVPMLPVVAGLESTRRQIVFYAVILALVTLVPSVMGWAGLPYTVAAGALNLVFCGLSLRVLLNKDDASAKTNFFYSILYLFLLFLALVIDHNL
ncbi:MAG: heme o synthase [Alphaproteobacteria bacterium]|nr:heme o synthase [Alphaproteobacteria bacterium]